VCPANEGHSDYSLNVYNLHFNSDHNNRVIKPTHYHFKPCLDEGKCKDIC